jgi:tetratricopeptide (TPR) repeat protein
MDEDEIRRRVERTTALESKAKSKPAVEPKVQETPGTPGPFSEEVVSGDKMSTADIFAETDIIPFVPFEGAEPKYYELKDQAATELRMLRAAYEQQAHGEMTQFERDLAHIVVDFRKDLKDKFARDGSETHYQLGIAFMDQGLYAEAIEELTQASREKSLAVDAYSAISTCYRRKRSFQDAEKWLKKALVLAKEGSDQYFALEFDLAEICEQADHRERALSLFKEIQGWNPGYRNISLRVEQLERLTGTQAT